MLVGGVGQLSLVDLVLLIYTYVDYVDGVGLLTLGAVVDPTVASVHPGWGPGYRGWKALSSGGSVGYLTGVRG